MARRHCEGCGSAGSKLRRDADGMACCPACYRPATGADDLAAVVRDMVERMECNGNAMFSSPQPTLLKRGVRALAIYRAED